MNHIQQQADQSIKLSYGGKSPGHGAPYNLYFSEVMIGNNNILVKSDRTMTVYLKHNTLSYLITSHPGFCEDTAGWLRNMIKKSTLISGVSEKQRLQFFRNAQEKVDELVKKVK